MSTMPKYVSTTNACKLCKPLGACLAFRGIEGAVPFLHGSQGCATYMRRYIISHFNEPIDIASSSLGEKHAVYGGAANLKLGLKNVTEKYRPSLVGIATTCLTETIGDDLNMIVHEYEREFCDPAGYSPRLVKVSTPSYSGSHMEGFHAAVKAVVEELAEGGEVQETVTVLPGFVSAADLRYLKELCHDFGVRATVLPDYSDTLDGQALQEYPLIPAGGTPLQSIRDMGRARATIECVSTAEDNTAGDYLAAAFGVSNHKVGLPIGIRQTDRFLETLEAVAAAVRPEKYQAARGRLIDALVDGHKYVFGKKAVVYGEEDLVVGLTSLLAEIGVQPVLCASGGRSGRLEQAIAQVCKGMVTEKPEVYENADFYEISQRAAELGPDLLIGHSKGYPLARKLDIPLIRVGFPIHDRIGGQRLLHLGYHGAQLLFDAVANAMIQRKQDGSAIGYSYM